MAKLNILNEDELELIFGGIEYLLSLHEGWSFYHDIPCISISKMEVATHKTVLEQSNTLPS